MPRQVVLILLALTLSSPALAQAATTGGALYTPYQAISELGSENPSDTAYAARWLWMRARSLARRIDRGGSGSGVMEARADFDDLRRLTVRPLQRCVVADRRSRKTCADTLGLVGNGESVVPLREALAAEDRPKVKAHVQAAIDALVVDVTPPASP